MCGNEGMCDESGCTGFQDAFTTKASGYPIVPYVKCTKLRCWCENRLSDQHGEPPVQPDKFEKDVQDVYDTAEKVLLRKHRDYGPKNISGSPGGPLNGLRVRMHDKLARINNLIDSGATPENESLRDSFLDLMNYSAIAMLVLDENWPES